MAHDQRPQFQTQAQHDKPVFLLRMVRVIIADRVLVEKDRLRLLERHAMLAFILSALPLVPLESDIVHKYIVRIMKDAVNVKDVNDDWLAVYEREGLRGLAFLSGARYFQSPTHLQG